LSLEPDHFLVPQAARKPLFGFKDIEISPHASPRHSLENELGKQCCLVFATIHVPPTFCDLVFSVSYTISLKNPRFSCSDRQT
jgi:hypothetical protein